MLDDKTVIGKNLAETMFDEIQNKEDDIFTWVAYGKDVNQKASIRYKQYIEKRFGEL